MISKEEFEKIYKETPISNCELFFLKHISFHSLYNNKFITILIALITLLPLTAEILFKIFNFPLVYHIIPATLYIIVIAILGIMWLKLICLRNSRLEKIRKKLNITKEEYIDLINLYYYNRYPSLENHIKYKTK